jgi:hypothetical protein
MGTDSKTRRGTGDSAGFSADERAAMKARAEELKGSKANADGEADILAKIAEMPEPDRSMAARVHALVTATAPALTPRTWYGMPAWSKDGEVLAFFKPAAKFKARYATLGFSGKARLDDGNMWPTDFALRDLTGAEEARIVALVKQAMG